MSVVGRGTRWRWAAVALGTVAVIGLPSAVPYAAGLTDRLAGSAERAGPAELVAMALASADVAHEGVAQTRGSLGLPDLPRLSGVPDLLGSTTKTRVWWSSPRSWRVDVVTPNGETGTYGVGTDTVEWDFEQRDLIAVVGADGARLPRADDLLPPQAVRRILTGLGPDDQLTSIDDRWVAGRTAAGVRVVPGDERSTVARLDLWVDVDTGLPVELHIVGQDGRDALESRFLQLELGPPDPAVLRPPDPSGVHRDWISAPDVAASADSNSPWLLPSVLAGLEASTSILGGTAMYGQGLVRFAVLPLPHSLSHDVLDGAEAAGGVVLDPPEGDAVLIASRVLNAVVVHGGDREHAYVIAGFVTAKTLEIAAFELLADPPPRRSS